MGEALHLSTGDAGYRSRVAASATQASVAPREFWRAKVGTVDEERPTCGWHNSGALMQHNGKRRGETGPCAGRIGLTIWVPTRAVTEGGE